jgi:phenylacetate-CoA ligase
VRPEDIRRPEDLVRLPVLTREIVRESQDDALLSENLAPSALVRHATNGTTGYSLTIQRTRFEERFLQGLRLVYLFELGMRLFDRRSMIRAADPLSTGGESEQTWWTRIGILRTAVTDCQWSPEEILSDLRRARPDVLGGYPSSMAWIAAHLTEEDRRAIRPRLVIAGGEAMSPSMRRQISEAFGRRVHDFYGANEFNLIAAECPAGTGNFHVCEASLIVEVLRDGRACKPGESGELVATSLYSYAMPFIRYELGDEVTSGEVGCPCGAPVKTLRQINGRTSDRFPMPDGETIHPYVLEVPLLQLATWMKRYQIVQERLDRIVVRCIPMPAGAPSENELSALGERLTEAAGSVQVVLELVDDIPSGPGGKFRLYTPWNGGDQAPQP